MPPNGASKRGSPSTAVPRVIPAIPHALNKNVRSKPSQAAQPSHTVKPAAETSTPETSLSQEQPVAPTPDAQPASVPDEPAVPGSESEATSNVPLSKPDADVDPEPDQVAEPSEPSSVHAPVDGDADAGSQLDINGIKETSVPPPAEAATDNVASSPTSQRNVRNLPPPFYPANQQSGPPSVASAQMRQDQPAPPAQQPVHHPRPSVNNLAFGGYRDSANSSPALVSPQSQNPMYQNYPGPSQGQPPFPTPAHAYHVSDPSAGPAYPPTFSPGPQTYGYPREFNNHHHNNNVASMHPRQYHQPNARLHQPPRRPFDQHMSQRYPPPPVQNMYPPQYVPVRPVDPHHEPPKEPTNPDAVPVRNNLMANRSAEQQPTVPIDVQGATRQPDPQSAVRSESTPITQYLRTQFGNAEFADCVVQLSHSGYLFPPTMLPAHGVILARSPKLRSLITMQHGSSANAQNHPKQLSVPISDRFLNFEIALMKALMRLYGEPLPDRDAVARAAGPSAYLEAGNVQAVQMRFALAYAAAGHFLQMDEIISHGLHLAESLLGWDTIGKALAFGLEGGLSPHFSQYETANKDKGSTSSVDDAPAKLDSPSAAPAYGYYSDRMLIYSVNFLVYNCPQSFTLSPSAPQMNDPPRLPAEAERKHSRSASRLSQIRFGEMTIDSSNAQDPASEQMSSILLSLPFPLLTHVLESNILGERLGWMRVAAIMRDVIQEREIRRQRAMKHLGASTPASAVEERLWRTVRWVESVEPTDQRPTGLKMTRRLAGDETPPSAGSNAA